MLSIRVASALLLLPVVLFFVYYGGILFALFIGIIAALALNEFFTMMVHEGETPLRALGGASTALLILNGLLQEPTLIVAAVGLLVFGGLLWELLFYHEGASMQGWAMTMAGVFYIGWPLSLAVALRELPADGLTWVVLTAAAIWLCDTGAYFSGRLLGGKLSGGRRFSPRWSPNKTWEGFFGGLLMALAATTALSHWFLALPLWQGSALGLVLGLAGVYGDLSESMLKRRVGVKDSGNLIPGHGGILDRIDSILVGAVVAYLFALWVVY